MGFYCVSVPKMILQSRGQKHTLLCDLLQPVRGLRERFLVRLMRDAAAAVSHEPFVDTADDASSFGLSPALTCFCITQNKLKLSSIFTMGKSRQKWEQIHSTSRIMRTPTNANQGGDKIYTFYTRKMPFWEKMVNICGI